MKQRFSLALLFAAVITGSAWAQNLTVGRATDRVPDALQTGMEQVANIRTKTTLETTQKYWTIGLETIDRDFTVYKNFKDYVEPLGIRKVRFQCGWARCERVKGQYDFGWIDEIVNDLAAHKVEMWAELSYGNPIYPGAGGFDLGAGLPIAGEGLQAWDRWVGAMVNRYKDRIHEWEIWNEADGNRKHTPAELIEFTIHTAKLIRSIDPQARIAALALCRFNPKWVKPFIDEVNRQNVADLFNWVSYHAYTYNPDDCYSPGYMESYNYMRKNAPSIKIRQGECGCPSEYQVQRHALKNYHWSELTQAKWFLRRMMGDRGHDVDEASIFCLMDMIYLYVDANGKSALAGLQQNQGYDDYKKSAANKVKFFNRFGLLMCDSNYQVQKIKQSYYAIRNVISIFDQPLQRVKDSRCSAQWNDKLTLYEFRNSENNKNMVVIWDGTQIPADTYRLQQARISVEGAAFKKPVWVDLLSGRVYRISDNQISTQKAANGSGQTTLYQIPVFDSPIIICDFSMLPVEK